jgi:hypothetical protein
MLSYLQSATIVLLSVSLALGLTLLLNRRLEADTRKRSNGVNGWQLSILASIYAVALGFMLSDAWLAYQTATQDVRAEAAAVLTIDRTAALLPARCSTPLQQHAQDYARTVTDIEFPAMQQQRFHASAQPIVRSMWQTINDCNLRDEPARDSVIRALEGLQCHRDARMEDYTGRLPLIMWAVMLFGAVIVIAASCLLGNEKQSIHCFHVVSLTILISLMLLAISDLDRPFDGATRIEATSFRAVTLEIAQPNH